MSLVTARENGSLFWDTEPAFFGYEYYRGELSGFDRLLPMSSYVLGKIPTDLMMNAYSIILFEEIRKGLRGDMWYIPLGLEQVGTVIEKDE